MLTVQRGCLADKFGDVLAVRSIVLHNPYTKSCGFGIGHHDVNIGIGGGSGNYAFTLFVY